MKSLSLSQPHIIAVIGVPGSGKTFFAEKFSETFHAPYVHFDKIVEISRGTQATLKALFDYQLDELLKTRQSIILEGMTDTRAERTDLQKKAKTAGYEVLFVWVQTDPATAQIRSTRPAKDSKKEPITLDEHTRLSKRFAAPAQADASVVISGKHTYATQAKVILKRISSPRTQAIATQEIAPPDRQEQPVQVKTSGRSSITVR